MAFCSGVKFYWQREASDAFLFHTICFPIMHFYILYFSVTTCTQLLKIIYRLTVNFTQVLEKLPPFARESASVKFWVFIQFRKNRFFLDKQTVACDLMQGIIYLSRKEK